MPKKAPEETEKEALEDEEDPEIEESETDEIKPTQDFEFHQAMQISPETSIPILEKITDALPAPETSTEQEASATTTTEKQEIDYATFNEPDYGETQEVKYQTSVEPPVLRPRETSRSRATPDLLDPLRERGINIQDTEPQKLSSGLVEQERRLPFEREERKYKEFKPRRF